MYILGVIFIKMASENVLTYDVEDLSFFRGNFPSIRLGVNGRLAIRTYFLGLYKYAIFSRRNHSMQYA